jgi:beta-lactam-binding protein with PASTA domain
MRGVDAEFQLRSLGFQVQVVSAPDRLSAGFVFRTEPVAGTPLRRGDTVTIFVSLGDKVRMPDVTGLAGRRGDPPDFRRWSDLVVLRLSGVR